MNPAFFVGQQIGNNFGESFRRAKDESAIEKILSESMQSKDPEVLQNNIGKILSQVSPERQKPALEYLQGLSQNIQKNQLATQKSAAERSAGVTPGIHPSLQLQQLKDNQKEQSLNQIYGPQGQPATQALGQPMQQATNPFASRSDAQLRIDSGSPYKEISEPAKAELNQRSENRKFDQKEKSEKNQRLSKRNDPIIKKLDEDALLLPSQQALLNVMRNQVETGELEGFSLNWLAELTGQDWMLSPAAAVFKTGAKQYFLGDLERIKGRANQLLEKQILNAQAKVGQSTGANLSVIRADQMRLDIKQKEIDVGNSILDKYREKGEEPANLAREINEQMKPIAQNIADQTQNDISAITYTQDGTEPKFTSVKEGTPISPYMVQALVSVYDGDKEKAREKAKKLGYKF